MNLDGMDDGRLATLRSRLRELRGSAERQNGRKYD
jgi:hypothetical protein